MFFTPDRLTTAGSHSHASTSSTEKNLLWPLLMKCSTYSTQPTAIAALPAPAVIQYDQALVNPRPLPKAARAYAYGPPSAGSRRDSAANSSASTSAHGGEPYRDEGDRAVARQRGGQVEDADADDAAD